MCTILSLGDMRIPRISKHTHTHITIRDTLENSKYDEQSLLHAMVRPALAAAQRAGGEARKTGTLRCALPPPVSTSPAMEVQTFLAPPIPAIPAILAQGCKHSWPLLSQLSQLSQLSRYPAVEVQTFLETTSLTRPVTLSELREPTNNML